MRRLHASAVMALVTVLVSACNMKNPAAPTVANLITIEGSIESLTPPANLAVAGRVILINNRTNILTNGQAVAFGTLKIGLHVLVKGEPSGQMIVAQTIDVLSPMTEAGPWPATTVSFGGSISSQSGSAPNLTLQVEQRTVLVSSSTDVRRRGEPQSPGTIFAGQTVLVTGQEQPNGTVSATVVDIVADDRGGTFIVTTAIGAMTGTCPDLHLMLLGYDVYTDTLTTWQTPCTDLAVGSRIEIVGKRLTDGRIAASGIKKL